MRKVIPMLIGLTVLVSSCTSVNSGAQKIAGNSLATSQPSQSPTPSTSNPASAMPAPSSLSSPNLPPASSLPSTSPAPLSNHDHTSTGASSSPVALTGERTLDNCETTVTTDVPEFFKTYFRCSQISVSSDNIVMTTRSLPPHKSYYYGQGSPNFTAFDTSRGSQYRANPNLLKEHKVEIRFPLNPTPKANLKITADLIDGKVGGSNDYKMGPAGIALDSVLLFNPLAAPGDDIENEKYTFDSYNAHPQQQGDYHYHTASQGPLEVLVKLGLVTKTNPAEAEIQLYGMMCDGTVVLGCTELDGSKPNTADFDAQNGHSHDLKSKDNKVLLANRYHTHLCASGLDKIRKFTPEIQYYSQCSAQ